MRQRERTAAVSAAVAAASRRREACGGGSAAARPCDGRSVIQAAAAVTPDSDRDGIARSEPQYPLTGSGLAVMVGMTDRKIFAGRRGGRGMPAPIPFPRAMFLRDPTGNYSHVMITTPLGWNALWCGRAPARGTPRKIGGRVAFATDEVSRFEVHASDSSLWHVT